MISELDRICLFIEKFAAFYIPDAWQPGVRDQWGDLPRLTAAVAVGAGPDTAIALGAGRSLVALRIASHELRHSLRGDLV